MRNLSRRRTSVGLILVALATLLAWPAKARVDTRGFGPTACACCADEGTWYQSTEKTNFHQIERVRFAAAANTYLPPSSEGEFSLTYALSHMRNGRRWQLKFRDEQGKTGTLSFTLPPRHVTYGADLHDQPAGGLGPSLYKEWRFAGTARVEGVLKRGIRNQARFHLILQGRGNACTEAEDFKHWMLQISGTGASYSFYGSLNKPE